MSKRKNETPEEYAQRRKSNYVGMALNNRECMLLERLQEGPATLRELATLIESDVKQVSSYLSIMRRKLQPLNVMITKHRGGNRNEPLLFELELANAISLDGAIHKSRN